MREDQRRLTKAFLTAVAAHLVFALCLGLCGFSFARKDPHILEVTLTSGAPASVQDVVEPEPEIIQRPDDIVDQKLKPPEKPKRHVVKKKTSAQNNGPVPKYTSENGAGDGSGNNEKGQGDGEGDGSKKGVPVTPPRLLSSEEPAYPESARLKNIQGTTSVKMLVNADGRVENAFTVGSSGDAALDAAATSVVYKWRFSPAKDAYGQKAPCYITIPIRFKLKN